MSTELAPRPSMGAIEAALMTGDLSKLNSEERLTYYRMVCDSMGINYLTRPFDYILLNGKLTLYAKKDATDQLRRINRVSIGEPHITFQDDLIVVTISGSMPDGRTDSEVGVVGKKDMQGNVGNAIMKAVTKAKRRLTLSLCGLGWLDETEVETSPNARVIPEPQALPASGSEPLPAPQPAQREQHTAPAQRPLGPEAMATALRRKAGWVKSGQHWIRPPDTEQRPPSNTQMARCAAVVGHALGALGSTDEQQIADQRHMINRLVWGRDSTKLLAAAEVQAMLDAWEDANKPYAPNDWAPDEVKGLLAAAAEKQASIAAALEADGAKDQHVSA